ncbi:MAG: hypothetical protein ACRDRH_07280 [Pseudonocardia sp.]
MCQVLCSIADAMNDEMYSEFIYDDGAEGRQGGCDDMNRHLICLSDPTGTLLNDWLEEWCPVREEIPMTGRVSMA